jgi:hypothetical protein
MADGKEKDRRQDLRIDATGTMHPLGVAASQALRARSGEWSLLPSPPEVVLATRAGRAGESARSLRLAGEVRTPGALCDVVAMIHQGGWSGELVILEDELARSIFFETGHVVGATTNAPRESLGEILWRFGAITRDQLDEVVRTAEKIGKRVAETAIDLEFVGPEDLFAMMARQVEEVFYAALHVGRAVFYLFDRFDEGRLVRRHHLSTGQLLMEAARRMDELIFFRERVPSDTWVPLQSPAAAGKKPPPELAEVLGQCDGRRSVAEIGRRIGQLEFEVTRAVFQLAAGGFVTVIAPRPEGAVAIACVYNRAIVEVHRVCDEAGVGRELRSGLAQFAMSAGAYTPLFHGAGPGDDGSIQADRIASNVAALAGDESDRWLAQQLVEYAGFALFHAGSLLGERADPGLNGRIADMLKPLRQPLGGDAPASLRFDRSDGL